VATPHLALRQEICAYESILAAGKHLFHIVGYEATSVEAVYREAGATEADFISQFGSKDGLLVAILEDGWRRHLSSLLKVQKLFSARERIKEVLHLTIEFLNHDRGFAELLLFEGTRVRDGQMMMLTPSYTDFTALLDSLVLIDLPREQADVLRSALMGACQGLVRDLILRERYGYPADFSRQQAERFVARLVDELMPKA